jgi:dTDP-4-amino-4,6-dideoxygalactose transaminase
MISFHPTISIGRYLSYIAEPCDNLLLKQSFEQLFPHHAITLTDSGRSALALAIEELGLRGKTLIIPAYLCNVLIPVLEAYDITPLFLDIDPQTYQPPRSAYNTEVLKKIDAVLLVATYGGPIPEELVTFLKNAKKIVIEDCAHCPLPSTPIEIKADARYYSLPKIAPVTDGGMVVLRTAPKAYVRQPRGFSLTLIKNWLKLFNVTSSVIFRLKRHFNRAAILEPFFGIRAPRASTKRMLCFKLAHARESMSELPWHYCIPFRVDNPDAATHALMKAGISSERLWNDPIILHPRAVSTWHAKPDHFPETLRAAKEVVCVPLWHIESVRAYEEYNAHLKEVFPEH